MPDIEIFGILTVKCSTIESRRHAGEINEHSMGGKSCTNTNLNANLNVNNNDNRKYIISLHDWNEMQI